MQGDAHKCYFHPYELLVDFKIMWSILSNTKIKVDLSSIVLLSERDIQAHIFESNGVKNTCVNYLFSYQIHEDEDGLNVWVWQEVECSGIYTP